MEISRRGDGIARVQGFVVFVKNAIVESANMTLESFNYITTKYPADMFECVQKPILI
jgi:tRNA/tmRNA/rRNA uracil-C5-methylase (TrmA/RlmC/RlmD family)